jgi:hypothetical protein
MTAHEKAQLTYKAIQKNKQKKKQQEIQLKQDLGYTGWNGYTKFRNRELKRFY